MFRKYQNVFRSRWRAAAWACGVCLTAYCTVPSPDGGEDDLLVTAGAIAAAAHRGEPGAAPAHHVNPWALDPKPAAH
jgi:hypothetical protein